MRNLMPPFFLGTMILGEDQELVDGFIRSLMAMAAISASASLSFARGNR